MAIVNPYSEDPRRAAVWEEGYDAGFAEPEVDHAPPYEADLLEAYADGERNGRDDRRVQPSTQDPFPSSPSDDVSRFESAPDGTLIPIPDEAPQGTPIRPDAQISVGPRTDAGYYVAIFNGPSDTDVGGETAQELFVHFWGEADIGFLEKVVAAAVREDLHLAVRFGGLALGVAVSLLSSSPILKETTFRGYLDDGTGIMYVILQPSE